MNNDSTTPALPESVPPPGSAEHDTAGGTGLKRPRPVAPSPWFRQPWLEALLLVLLAVIAYLPALFSGFVWDDAAHIQRNTILSSPDALYRIWCTLDFQQYLPVQLTTFWAELKLWGYNPLPFHAANVLLHALNGVLIWQILKRLRFPVPWLAAALFLLHPVNVETVAWITERRNLLSAAFYLGAVLCWLKFDEGAGKRWHWATLGLYLLALLSKTVACSLPVILLLLGWMRRDAGGGTGLKQPRPVAPAWFRDVLLALPFFAIGIPLGLLTSSMERYLIGANGYEWDFSLAERILICGRALWFYALKDLWPANLVFFYPRWHLNPADWTQWLWVAAALAAIAGLIPLVRCCGRRAAMPLLFFGITLFPALGFANIYPQRFSIVADHFQYLASLGVIVFALGAAHWLLQSRGIVGIWGTQFPIQSSVAGGLNWDCVPRIPAWLRGAVGTLLLVLGAQVWLHASAFSSDESLWREVLRKNNDAWLAHANWGVQLHSRGNLEASLHQYEEALRCGPEDLGLLFDLGDTCAQLGRAAEARRIFNEALAKSPAFEIVQHAGTRDLPWLARAVRALARVPPDFLPTYERHRVQFSVDILLGLARLDAAEGNSAAALRCYSQALELCQTQQMRPFSEKVYLGRGRFHEQAGRTAEALADYRSAATVAPQSGEGLFLEGNLLHAQGRPADAVSSWEAALARQPSHAGALVNLGAAYKLAGRQDEAAALFEHALALQPEHFESLYNLSGIAMAKGDLETVVRLYRRMLAQKPEQLPQALRPNWCEVCVNLGVLLARQGQLDGAIALFKQAQQVQPAAPDSYVHLAKAQMLRREYAGAAQTLRAGLDAAGADPAGTVRLRDELAWLLATCPDDKVRDGAEALRLAQQANADNQPQAEDRQPISKRPEIGVSPPQRPQLLDTLAAAQAESGEFAAAAATARKAEDAAKGAGQTVLAQKIAERRKLYEEGKPYREKGQ